MAQNMLDDGPSFHPPYNPNLAQGETMKTFTKLAMAMAVTGLFSVTGCDQSKAELETTKVPFWSYSSKYTLLSGASC